MIAYDNASTGEQRHIYQMGYQEIAWRDESTGAHVCTVTLIHPLDIPVDFVGTIRTDAVIALNPDLPRVDDASTANVPVYEDVPLPQNWFELGSAVFEGARGFTTEEADAVRRIRAKFFKRI